MCVKWPQVAVTLRSPLRAFNLKTEDSVDIGKRMGKEPSKADIGPNTHTHSQISKLPNYSNTIATFHPASSFLFRIELGRLISSAAAPFNQPRSSI